MDKKQNPANNDRSAEEALRDEKNKPEPLYDKTDRNFQRANQEPQQGTTGDASMNDEQQNTTSSSSEEKDII